MIIDDRNLNIVQAIALYRRSEHVYKNKDELIYGVYLKNKPFKSIYNLLLKFKFFKVR